MTAPEQAPRSLKKWILGAALLAAALAGLVTLLQPPSAFEAGSADPLAKLEATVARDYAAVEQLPVPDLATKLKAGEPVMLFDVREAAEFAVSHIPGAERVSPGVRTAEFLKTFGNQVKDKVVVFYCSVGVRSSKLAEQVQATLRGRGAAAVFNLRGGIFRWHNQSRALSSGTAATDLVHPYDDYWGRYLTRRNLARYQSRP